MSEASLAMEMNKLNSRIDELDKKVTSIELNEQRYLKKNNPIHFRKRRNLHKYRRQS